MNMVANQAHAASAIVVGRRGGIEPDTWKDMAALTLNDLGIICDCNLKSETLFKYRRSELVLQHVSLLLPQLVEMELMQNGQPNLRLRFLCRTGRLFQAVTRSGEQFACTLFFNHLDKTGYGRMSLIVRPAEGTLSDRWQ